MMRLMDSDATIVALERAGLELGARGRIEEAANYFIAARILRESALLKPIEAEPVRHAKVLYNVAIEKEECCGYKKRKGLVLP